jgi:Hypothetical glycosyl hydrolase 6/Beta-galactosidase trimerisation domain
MSVPNADKGEKNVPGGPSSLPHRMVHLDFHTGPRVPNVGAGFDPDAFARSFKDARAQSVTVFAKCHHGHLYFDTSRPERHPGLVAGLDLTGQQIEALHSAGIRAPIYISVQCDEYAADSHPEWVALTPELRQVRRPVTDAYHAGWQILDMSSPYQDYLAGQIEEVLGRYAPVDGMFLDMCWDQPSSSQWARAGMKREGLDPRDDNDRARYARAVAHRYMERFAAMIVPAVRPGSPMTTWFNSRPKLGLETEAKFVSHIEVESLASGEAGGYDHLPYVGRAVREFGLPVAGMTGRFHRGWGDMASLKTEAALRYECCQMLMHGLSVSVGDLLPPSGVPTPGVYGLIGSVFSYLEDCQRHVAGGRPLAEVALLVDLQQGDVLGAEVTGALRALQQLRQQFGVVGRSADLDSYKVVVVPGSTTVDQALADKLVRYANSGGCIILAAAAAAGNAKGEELLRAFGWEIVGTAPFSTTFLRGVAQRSGEAPPLAPFGVRVHGESFVLDGTVPTEAMMELVFPYFERSYDAFSGHSYTPPAVGSGRGAVVRNNAVIVLAAPLFSAIAEEGNPEYRRIIGECLDALLPRPILRVDGPVHLETSVVETDDAFVVHLVSFLPSRLGRDLDLVYDPFPLVNVKVELRAQTSPTRVSLEPAGQELPFGYEGSYARTRVTVLDGHAMVVFSK